MGQKQRKPWAAILLIAALLPLAAGPAAVRADGYVISEPVPSSSIMADQKAVIIYGDGHEEMIVSIGLDTSAVSGPPDLAWIIPVPSLPDIQVTDRALFDELDQLSAPEIVYQAEQRGGFGLQAGAPAPEVQVLERKEVGVYDVAVLAGREGGALLDWLNSEGFALPDALKPALEAYIAEGWTFVAMRISPDVDQDELFSAQPVWLSFDTGQTVYPMRLTGIRSEPLALRLYILADHRYQLDGFTLEFAGQVQVKATDPHLAPVLNRERYLTKLFDPAVTPAEMAGDFYPSPAPDDGPYREQVVRTYVSSGPGVGLREIAVLCGGCWLGLLILLVVVVAVILLLRRRHKKGTSADPPLS